MDISGFGATTASAELRTYSEIRYVNPALPQSELRFDSVRITAWLYAVYCLTLWPIRALEVAEPTSAGKKLTVIVICMLCAAAAVSATRRKRIGYRFCYAFSLLLLAGPPFGTILAWNMIQALRRNRDQFWPPRPRPSWMQRYEPRRPEAA